MLDEFILLNRDALIARARERVAARMTPKPTHFELANGIPAFLDQLCDALRRARTTDVVDHDEIVWSAGLHGLDLHRIGLTVGQVVHDYGDICQTITELAVELSERIATQEFKTLNLCLDDAIAGAVSAYSNQHEQALNSKGTERLGFLAHEMRNLLNTAMLSFDSIKTGRVAPGGSTALVHGRSLVGLRDVINRSLADVRLDIGPQHTELISVADLIEEIEIGATFQAEVNKVHFSIETVERTITIEGDRQIVAAAISNLLANAFKFSRKQGHISLNIRTTPERVLFDVEDECGGLTPAKIEGLRDSLARAGAERSGLGLGLSIAVRAAKASAGAIHVRNVPEKGCVFTLDLPRKPPPPLVAIGGTKQSNPASGGVETKSLEASMNRAG